MVAAHDEGPASCRAFEASTEGMAGSGQVPRHWLAVSARLPMTDRQYLTARCGSMWARAQLVRDEVN
jgi:hypothetical protein